eukprot:m.333598 g.333598  ORF g.333598 m.333598 type:complete len:257 (+) comp17180_c0_seq1:353-1123(+)
MAESLVTQVQREDVNTNSNKNKNTKKKQGSLLSRICCCPSSSGADTSDTDYPTNEPAPSITPPRRQQQTPSTLQAQANGLLGPIPSDCVGKKCLVLDLDETLVHSSFKPVPYADYVIPIFIEGQTHKVYVLKRPHVDEFLTAVGKLYEVVLFTASLAKYADPVTDLLDPNRVCRHRLFREHCVFHRGSYVKDLSKLGRDLSQTIIVDNSPVSYIFHPDNAVPVKSWFDDKDDTELKDLISFFQSMAGCNDVREFMR